MSILLFIIFLPIILLVAIALIYLWCLVWLIIIELLFGWIKPVKILVDKIANIVVDALGDMLG